MLPTSERAHLQDELCGNDSALLREVESLLSARDRSDRFLSPQSLESHVAELLAEPELSGQALGYSQVVSLIGEGAMGKVYMAPDTRLDWLVA